MAIRIAIVGFGKIARDQHVPAILADPRFELAAIATSSGDPGMGVPWFDTTTALLAGLRGQLDAVSICTPPQARHYLAREALDARLSVLLEKPPAATLGEVEDLERRAKTAERALFATWHSQHAAAVPIAAELLASAEVTRLRVEWLEDVRKWHPGQEWIWQPGGFGVFDPGINALSILTRILPKPLFVRQAQLLVPSNRQAPIAASLAFAGGDLEARFDWRHAEGQSWTVEVETPDRTLVLKDGGARILVDGTELALAANGEYPSIYNRFAALVESGTVDVDREPLRIVADAFLTGSRTLVEPFD